MISAASELQGRRRHYTVRFDRVDPEHGAADPVAGLVSFVPAAGDVARAVNYQYFWRASRISVITGGIHYGRV
ncbi:MAG: hypothetical protein ACRDSL_22905 [Pseudonocardiaceae bacterium]